MTKPSIYIASKAKYAPVWTNFRTEGWNIISTWIDFWEEDTIVDWSEHWVRCIREAGEADYTIAYTENGDILKGALAEIGAALAHGKTVFFVGTEKYVKEKRYSVFKHPKVVMVDNLQQAFDWIGLDQALR